MASRSLMTAAGVLWGLLLGAGAGLLASAVAAGAAWLFVFGDDAWPWWAEWAIIGAGLAVGLAVFTGCLVLTRMVARRYRERDTTESVRGGSAIAWLLIVAALAAAGTFVWNGYRTEREANQVAAARVAADADFRTMVSAVHRIGRIEIDWPGGGLDGRAVLSLEGWRAGRYRLNWSVQERVYGHLLIGGERTVTLDPGASRIEVDLPAPALAEGYRNILDRPDASILVDETMDFAAVLRPDLTTEERAALPENELRNLQREWSDLIDHAGAEVIVRFHIFNGRLSWDGT